MPCAEMIRKAEIEFFDMIVTGKSLSDLADCAYDYFDNPLAISNGRGQIICTSNKNRPYNDNIWDEVDLKRYIPLEVRARINPERPVEETFLNGISIIRLSNIAHRSMVCQAYVKTDFLVRLVILESKRPFNKCDGELARLFLKVVLHYLRNSKLVQSTTGNSKEYFLYELLSNRIDYSRDEGNVLEYLGLKATDKSKIMVARSTFENPANTTILDALTKLRSIFPISTAFLHGQNIVLLITERGSREDINKCFEELYKYINRAGLISCLSHSFRGINNISVHYQIVSHLIEIGQKINKSEHVYFAGDMMADYILDKLDADKKDFIFYPPIIELLEMDKRNNTKLTSSLFAYALTLGNCTISAKLLDISYNSMRNRLEQIFSIIGDETIYALPAIDLTFRLLFLTGYKQADDYFAIYYRFRELQEEQHAF